MEGCSSHQLAPLVRLEAHALLERTTQLCVPLEGTLLAAPLHAHFVQQELTLSLMLPPAPVVQLASTALAQEPPAALPAWLVQRVIMGWAAALPPPALVHALLASTLLVVHLHARPAQQELMGLEVALLLRAQEPAILGRTAEWAHTPLIRAQLAITALHLLSRQPAHQGLFALRALLHRFLALMVFLAPQVQ